MMEQSFSLDRIMFFSVLSQVQTDEQFEHSSFRERMK